MTPNDDSREGDLVSCLAGWAVSYGISLIALSALLALLRIHFPSLPKDARTLLRTSGSKRPHMVAGGQFYYFGVQSFLMKTCKKVWSKIPDLHTLKLQLNFDGIPLFHSNAVQLWPILGIIQDFKGRKPFVIALFCGRSKPKCLNEYLKDLVAEMRSLGSGFNINGKQVFLRVTSVICDAPARAFIKAIKTHTGYSGCGKCTQTGLYMKNRMTFPENNAPL